MTPEKINAVIAAVVMPQHLCKCGHHWRQSDHVSCGNKIPDYFGSLDAMHEAEKILTGEQWNTYLALLHKCQTWQSNPFIGILKASFVADYNVCRAEASQRCEAFIKTVCPEKWEE
jgi:hypothetical protein